MKASRMRLSRRVAFHRCERRSESAEYVELNIPAPFNRRSQPGLPFVGDTGGLTPAPG